MKKFIGSVAVFSMILGLAVVGYSNMDSTTWAKRSADVKLRANMPWANSGYKNCQQMSGEGNVYSSSLRDVAWVLEYRGADGQWHYQIPSDNWNYFSPGTTVPVITGKVYGRCDQRLQLNPKGKGDAGKGGIADGWRYVVK